MPRPWAEGRGKRPDVQASKRAVRYAFEAQLSSTSAMVIPSRNRFYRSQGAVVSWSTDHIPDDEWRMYLVES